MMETEDTYVLFNRGLELIAEGQHRRAAIVLEKACQLEPEKTSIREALARAFFNSGQTRRAEEEFEKVMEQNPADHYAVFGLAMCRARLGDKARAIGLLKIALAMRPQSEDYLHALARLAG